MTKKLINYAYWAFGLTCASLFVEGAGQVHNNYTINNSGSDAHVHSRNDIALTDGDKLIVTYAFENAGFHDVSVNLSVGGSVFDFSHVVDSNASRHVGISYIDVTSAMASVGSLGTVSIDLGVHSESGSGYSAGDDVLSGLGASIIRVSGLVAGDADYTYSDKSIFGGSSGTGTVSLSTTEISDGMFVVSGFTCNGNNGLVADSNPSGSNTSYTSTYYAGVGSASAANGYIETFDSSRADLSYDSTGGASNALIYAAWAAAIPEPRQASALIATLTICFYTIRQRVV